jgi:predicted anti-sigma-YlaC factor YlaD
MNCAEFQRDLPLIIDSGGTEEQEEHLRTCEVCRDLVNDLRYIAEQAKLLVPMQDPSPKVWEGIEQKLKVEGLVKPLQARRSL